MRKFLTLLFLSTCLTSCLFFLEPNPPCRPPQGGKPGGGQPWWTDNTNGNNNNGGNQNGNNPNDTTGTSNNNGDNNDPNRRNTSNTGNGLPEDFVPTAKYDSCTIDGILTFNVYLGWNVGAIEEVVMLDDYPGIGGEIIFNIYTNNHYMSMYGFEKWRTDFYVFSSEEPYCGYSSYSLETKPICQYRMIIKKNDSNAERYCCGYWSSNYNAAYDGSFKIHLFQRFLK